MIRTLKIRLLPTEEQEQMFWNHIGAARFIYNYMLAEQKRRYDLGEKHMSAFDMNKAITALKQREGMEWMSEISVHTFYRACDDLAAAFTNFFVGRARYPRFKSRKHSKPSFPVQDTAGVLWFSETHVQVPKVGKVKYQTNYDIPKGRQCKFSNPRIQLTPNGKWILTVGVERDSQALELTSIPMGIDVGVKELATVSFGDESFVFHNINKSRVMRQQERRLKHLQRNIARKYRQHGNYEKTSNILKAEAKVRRAQYRLANTRNDYRHQVTHELVSKLPGAVVMETLNVQGMMKNRHLSKAVAQQGFFEFIIQMKYKCEERGIAFIQVPQFYPSSKTCSNCGAIKRDLRLSERVFVCPECGHTLDRDLNAAINLARYADQITQAAA